MTYMGLSLQARSLLIVASILRRRFEPIDSEVYLNVFGVYNWGCLSSMPPRKVQLVLRAVTSYRGQRQVFCIVWTVWEFWPCLARHFPVECGGLPRAATATLKVSAGGVPRERERTVGKCIDRYAAENAG